MNDSILADLNLGTLSEDALNALRIAVLTEQERRRKRAALPDDLAAMARDAATAGCDPDELITRVTTALTDQETPR